MREIGVPGALKGVQRIPMSGVAGHLLTDVNGKLVHELPA